MTFMHFIVVCLIKRVQISIHVYFTSAVMYGWNIADTAQNPVHQSLNQLVIQTDYG